MLVQRMHCSSWRTQQSVATAILFWPSPGHSRTGLPNHSSLPLSFPLKMFSQIPSGLWSHMQILSLFASPTKWQTMMFTIIKKSMDGFVHGQLHAAMLSGIGLLLGCIWQGKAVAPVPLVWWRHRVCTIIELVSHEPDCNSGFSTLNNIIGLFSVE